MIRGGHTARDEDELIERRRDWTESSGHSTRGNAIVLAYLTRLQRVSALGRNTLVWTVRARVETTRTFRIWRPFVPGVLLADCNAGRISPCRRRFLSCSTLQPQ